MCRVAGPLMRSCARAPDRPIVIWLLGTFGGLGVHPHFAALLRLRTEGGGRRPRRNQDTPEYLARRMAQRPPHQQLQLHRRIITGRHRSPAARYQNEDFWRRSMSEAEDEEPSV